MKGIILFTILFGSLLLNAQVKHTVKEKETLYGLAKQYHVSQEEIIQANPLIKERGLQIGDEIIIPASQSTNHPPTEAQNFSDNQYQYITVKHQETLYNLSKTYDISIEALKSINPSLSEGLKEGDVIRVPKSSNKNPEGYHQMKEGETLYSISRAYGVSVEDVLLANRDLQVDNLQIGQFIKIPSESLSTPVAKKDNDYSIPTTDETTKPTQEDTSKIKNGYFEYTIKEGETVFSLLNTFDITLKEFVQANPNVKSGIKAGEAVKIPLKSDTKFSSNYVSNKKDDTIRIALLLPFYLEDESKKGEREVSTLFLSGAKLALDSLSSKGAKLKVDVIDSGNEELFQKSLNNVNFTNVDLMVGPFYKKNLVALRQKTQQSNVPIVSPLVKDDELTSYSNIIFAEIDDKTLADKIIEEVNNGYAQQKIILLTDNENQELANYMKSQFENQQTPVQIIYSADQLEQKQNLITESYEEIVPIIVTDNEKKGQEYIDKIDELDNNTVHPFSVFYLINYDQSANIAKLRKKGFIFVADRKVNTKGVQEKKTLDKYEAEYCQSPPKYAVIGFDIVYDLVSRMDASKNITPNMNQETTQLATKYMYVELPSHSYENKGVRVIRYTKL